MIVLGIALGIYSYSLFFLGLLGLLQLDIVRATSFVFLALLFAVLLKNFKSYNISSMRFPNETLLFCLFLSLLVIMSLINLVGVVGPELAFDALWYHLTLPKLYLAKETLVYIPGGLLYYSAMPKLAELSYLGGITLGGEVYPKITQFLFGVFTLILIYKASRLFVSKTLSLFACVLFYANLVVAWESIAAYVDLVWTFYAFGSTYLLLLFTKEKKKIFLYLSGVFVGLAICVKLVAVGSVFLLFLFLLFLKLYRKKTSHITKKDFLFVTVIITSIPIPWFLFSFIHTGNPIYPFFSTLYQTTFPLFSARNVFDTVFTFLFSADPISPIYILCLPLLLMYLKQFSQKEKSVFFLGGVALAIWFLSPKSGGGRFLLPYLPLFSVLVAIVIEKTRKNKELYRTVFLTGIIIMIISIGYRTAANAKYLAVIQGVQTKQDFLTKHLNFSFGDFYDTDGYFAKTILPSDIVLLYGFHNLYYVNFPFIHESWIRHGDRFTYIAVQNTILPQRFNSFQKVYENALTGVRLYKPVGSKEWIY